MADAVREMEIRREFDQLTSRRKTAVVLLSLPPGIRRRIMDALTTAEIGSLYWEMGLLPSIAPGVRLRILSEFRRRVRARFTAATG